MFSIEKVQIKFLELKNVTKVIKREVVLNDINLSINTGKIIGIVGPYSSGKTMLLRAIAGLVEIDQGSIALKGEAVGLNRQRTTKVGATIETPGFNPACTVLENLRFLASFDNVVGDQEIHYSTKKIQS
ncbi:ABC transporter ATP-binding protein [Lactobacillus xylocopicola]|uniref:ABC transporter domain-containing protein n=1 Tax=Lactobacillus xylocopicola TaxID=2976676 RepID=A0ABN6SKD2_9LACO|nr:ATP-binding cassette domain-containing protein [Lactobacillus xylocopicola]BDR60855.1 hypothetical protein KIM322_11160 [Lactobacillus xylocopicola]